LSTRPGRAHRISSSTGCHAVCRGGSAGVRFTPFSTVPLA
jgi:hypothetical protein